MLYLALEDDKNRLHKRMRQQHWPQGLPADFMEYHQFRDQIDNLRDGGGERLALEIKQKGYRFVVIDTLSRSVYGDESDKQEMTSALAPVQENALENNCAVMMTDHHHKQAAADVIADVLGSTAKGGTADTIWGLYRESGKARAKLAMIGRDVAPQTVAITFDGLTGCWQYEGDDDELAITERRAEILDALEALGRSGVVDIAEASGQPKSHAYGRLQDLVGAGLVHREKEGRRVFYSLA